jgi:S-ribosylhomocysteine lyase LuxS involved in autoinducer biosynthesis
VTFGVKMIVPDIPKLRASAVHGVHHITFEHARDNYDDTCRFRVVGC